MEGNFNQSFTKVLSQAKQFGIGLLAGIGGAFSAIGVATFIKGALDAVGTLHDLADQTGFAATTLLKLKPILNDAGTSSEDFAKGINALQKEIVGGSAEVVAALAKMGLSIDDMLASADDPEGLVDKLAKGLANLSTQAERVAVAKQLLARGGPKIAVALGEIQARGGLGAIPETGGITEDQIAQVDRLGRKFDELKIKAQVFAAVSFLGIIDSLSSIAEHLEPVIQLFTKLASLLPSLDERSLPGGLQGGGGGSLRSRIDPRTGTTFDPSGASPAIPSGITAFRNFPAPTFGNFPGATGAPKDISGFTFTEQAPKPPSGITETDQQREFKKALEQTNEGLRSQVLALTQSKEAAIANAASILETKAATLGLAKDNADLVKQLTEFKKVSLDIAQASLADQLTQQNRSIEANIASMKDGAQAAEELAIRNALLASKLGNVGQAALDAAKRQRELNSQQAQAAIPQTSRELDEAKAAIAKKKILLGVTFNADDAVRGAIESALTKFAEEKDPRAAALAFTAALKLQPELNTTKLESIKTDLETKLGLDKTFGSVLNQTFTNTFDVAGAKVDNLAAALQDAKAKGLDPFSAGVQKIAADFDRARLDQATSNVARDLKIASNEAQVFGRSFDLGAANVSALQSQLQNLIHQGLSPANAEVQKLSAQLAAAKVDSTFRDLAKDLDTASKEAEVFGVSFNETSARIDALTTAIKRLIAEGFTPLSPEIRQLKQQLDDTKAAERFEQAFQGIGTTLADAISDIATNPRDWKQAITNLGKRINDELIKALVGKPIEDWLKAQATALTKIVFPTLTAPVGGVPTPKPTEQSVQAATNVATNAADTLDAERGTELIAAAAKSSGEITVASATMQTSATTFESATIQFAAAVEQFAAAVALPQASIPTADILTDDTGAIGSSLGLNTGTLTGDVARGNTQESFMRDATATLQELDADLAHAQATGGSLLSRRAGGTGTVSDAPIANGPIGLDDWIGKLRQEQLATNPEIGASLNVNPSRLAGDEILKDTADLTDEWSKVAEDGFKTLDATVTDGLGTLNETSVTGFDGFFKSLIDIISRGLSSLSGGGATATAGGGGGGGLGGFGGLFSSVFGLFGGGGAATGAAGASLGTLSAGGAAGSSVLGTLGAGAAGGGAAGLGSTLGAGSFAELLPLLALAHSGGEIGDIVNRFHTGGEINDNSATALPIFHYGGDIKLPRFHFGAAVSNQNQLSPGEVIIIAKQHEFVINDKSAAKLGKPVLEFINRTGQLPDSKGGDASATHSLGHSSADAGVASAENTLSISDAPSDSLSLHRGGEILPRYHFGGSVGGPELMASGADMNQMNSNFDMSMNAMSSASMNDMSMSSAGPVTVNFSVNNPQDADSFRRSRPQIMSDLGRTVKRAMKYT